MAAIARSAITAGTIGCIGDAAIQGYEGGWFVSGGSGASASYDTGRAARLCAYRAFQAPILDVCWTFFDRRIPGAGTISGTVARAAADQCLLMPPFMCTFFYSQALGEGLPHAERCERVRGSFPGAAAVCVPYWGTIHLVTFGAVPPRLRIAWTSVAAVGWNAYLSFANQQAVRSERAAAAAAARVAQVT